MTIDSTELRRLASEATPGPWRDAGYMDYGHDDVFGCNIECGEEGEYADRITWAGQEGLEGSVRRHADADYIAAANPSAILALLADLEAKTARVTELEHAAGQALQSVNHALDNDRFGDAVEIDLLEAYAVLQDALAASPSQPEEEKRP